MTQPREKTSGESLDVKTLILTSIAALIAAVVTQAIWGKGALISTALTPVIIALVREALNRPTEKITAKASRVTLTPERGAAAIAGDNRATRLEQLRKERLRAAHRPEREPVGAGVPAAGAGAAPPPPVDDTRSYGPTRPLGPGEDGGETADTAPAAAAGQPAERKVYGRRRRFRLKHALLTAGAAFLIAVAALTIPELVLGGSVGGGERTTLFGGGSGGDDRGDGSDRSGGEDGEDSGSESSGSDSGESGSQSQAAPDGSTPAPEEEAPASEEEPAPEEEAPAPEEEEPAPAPAPRVPVPSGTIG